MAEDRKDDNYLEVISGISHMLDSDDPENDYPISNSMKLEQRYIDGQPLGEGAVKHVTLSKDELTDREVAMAKLREPDNLEYIENFFLEARLTARLQHPNIVPVYDSGYDANGHAFFTMKPVSGLTLRHFIRDFKEGPADFQGRFDIFIKVCEAMSYAHSKGVIHRDLKPDNIYLGDYGEVLVGDWGLAKVDNEDDTDFELYSQDDKAIETMHGLIKGTPGYMAPEQIDKRLGPSDQLSDIYALGVILFELLTLERPTHQKEVEEILKETLTGIDKRPSLVNPSVPESVESIILKALSLKRAERYQSVKELVVDIRKFQGGFITSAESRSFIKSFVYLMKRHKAVSALMFLIIMSSLLFVSFIVKEKKIAEYERNEAVEQKKIALKQKDLADKARFEREKISKEASPRFLAVAEADLARFRFESAAQNIRLAVSLDPNNEEAIRFLGFYLFLTHKFTEAKKVLDSIGKKNIRLKLYVLAEKYASIKKDDSKLLEPGQVLKFLESTKNLFNRDTPPVRVIHHLVNYTYTKDQYTLEEKLSFAEEAYRIVSDRFDKSWQFKAKIVNQKINLDLSDQPVLALDPIRRLPLHTLNISGTNVRSLSELVDSGVEVLILGNKRISVQEIRKVKSLKEIHVSTNYLIDKLRGIKVIKR